MKYFQNKYDFLVLVIGLMILSIAMFFPVSSDMAMFIHGGMILNNGGALYVDYFDVKPPFIYYFYEFLFSMFGKEAALYRIFDFFYQSTFLLSSVYIFKKLEFSRLAIRLFAVLMPIAYVTLSFPNTFQVESLLFLPMIWYFYLSSKSHCGKFDMLLKGLLLGLMINLKYTFGILLIADIIYSIIQKKEARKLLSSSLVQLTIAALVTLVIFSPIIASGNFQSFLDFFSYMKSYSNYPVLGFSWLQYALRNGTSFFTDNYSLFLLLAALYTVFHIGKKNKEENNTITIKGVVVFALILFASVVIERKLLIYHEQRILPFLVMLSAIGLSLLIPEIRKYKKLTIAMVLSVAVLFSPIPRLINIMKFPAGVISLGATEFYSTVTEGAEGLMLRKQFAVADYINNNVNTDKVLLINTGGNEIICYFNFDYIYAFPQSAFYLNDTAPNYLKEKAFDDIKDAEIVILQNNDISHNMFFNYETSFSSIQKNLVIWNYIQSNFKQETVIEDNFIIYKRIPSNLD